MKEILLTLFVLGFCHLLISQTDPQTTWEDNMGNPNISFFELQKDYNNYWLGMEPPKGSGHKPFKRWEYLMETRVNKEGFYDPLQRQQVFNEYFSKNKNTNKSMSNPWVALGPFNEPSGHNGLGRINVIVEHPTNSSILFVGTPAGGLWKSTDGGTTWSTTTDNLTALGVSDIAFDPVDPDIMYIATGDRDHNDTSTFGIMKSTDGGATWSTTNFQPSTNGLPSFYLIHRMLIDPSDGNIMVVSTTDGVFRSIDGGVNWTNVLPSTCIRHMEFKPGNSNFIYGTTSGSYCGGLHSVATYYRSTNNGASWTQITLPNTTDLERIAIGVTDDNTSVVYMLASENDSGNSNDFFALYKSTDSGATVSEISVNTVPSLGSQQWYDWSFAVSPTDENKLIAGGVGFRKSSDGGVNWGTGGSGVHVDHHYARYYNNNLYLGTDGGIYKSTNNGTSWTDLSSGLAIMQFYRISNAETDNTRMLAGSQDNGTHQKIGSTWQDEYGGDGMDNAIDPNDATNLFVSWQYGHFLRSTNSGGSFTTMIDNGTTGVDGAWVTPIKIDPNSTSTIYVGYDRIWKSTNDGVSWTDPYGSALTSGSSRLQYIDVAQSNSNYLYVTDYSKIWRSTNGGTSWTEVTDPGSSIRWLEIDPTDETHLWACVNHDIFESTNSGSNWSNISGSLPNIDMNTIVYDEGTNDALYLGTDLGVFYIDNSESDWQPYDTSLPNVVILELDILESDNKLRAATFGRGVWETDLNVTPCSIDGVADEGLIECDELTSTYVRQLEVTYSGAPSTGTLDVMGQSFAITSSPQLVSVTNLPLDGISNDVTAEFSADTACNFTETNLFTNPTTCPCIIQNENLVISPCDDNSTTTPTDDNFTFSLDPIGQNLALTYSVSGDVVANNISYGAPHVFDNGGVGFLISNGNLTINITDDGGAVCSIDNILITAPNTCSDNYICSDAWELSSNGNYSAIGPNQGNGGSQTDGNGNPYNANWYYFTPQTDGYIQIGSCGGGVDTRLLLHEGTCGSINLLILNDDFCEMSPGGNPYASYLEYCVDAGVTYYIEWDNIWSSSGFSFDYSFTSGMPTAPTINTFPYNESFESDPNTWVFFCDDDMNWSRNSGGTPSANTGPTSAQNGSYYYYLEATGNSNNYTYHLGPTFDFSNATSPELSFYYHMYGSDMGTLKMELSTNAGQSWTNIFSKSGDQGNQWFMETIDLTAYSGQMVTIRFYGLAGSDFRSDMAFDNIEVTAVTAPPCPPTMDLDGDPIADGLYEAIIMNSTGTIPVNGIVTIKAADEINLNPGFISELGSEFEGIIGPCTNMQNEEDSDN